MTDMLPRTGLLSWLAGAVLLAGACQTKAVETPPPAPAKPEPVAAPRATTPQPAPQAESRVVARADGEAGEVVVEERDGRRVLRIGEIVQGSVPIEDDGIMAKDPLVELVNRVARGEGRVLLVGLGTGATARQLARQHRLEVIELEPKVIEFAREHFGYAGEATQGDGADVLRTTNAAYKAIVLDAFDGTRPPEHLVNEAGLRAAADRLLYEGVLALRLLGEPDAAWVDAIRRGLAPLDVRVFGTGRGSEMQNLYLLASRRRIQVDLVFHRGVRQVYPAVGEPQSDLQLVGYLVREASSGDLVLDVAHEEMGAQRYVLQGPLADKLATELPNRAQFPVENDAPPGPGIAAVPRDLVGGEGVMRSDLRFSPVVVAIRGTATLLASVHPNMAVRHEPARRQTAALLGQPLPKEQDPRLPRGGALYAMTVSEIRGVYTKRSWQRVRRTKLRAPLDQARAKISKGDLAGARAALGAYLELFDEHFADVAPMLRARAGIADVILLIAANEPLTPTPLHRAGLCRRLADYTRGWRGDTGRLADPFVRCAMDSYETAIGPDPKAQPVAARAFIDFLDDESDRVDFDDPANAKRLRRRMMKLVKKSGQRPKR